MLKKLDLLRLVVIASLLLSALFIITVKVQPPTRVVVLPTLMQLPSESVAQVAVVSTEVAHSASLPVEIAPTLDAIVQSTVQAARVSTDAAPVTASDDQKTERVASVRSTRSQPVTLDPTATSAATSAAIPTALPFPTLSIVVVPSGPAPGASVPIAPIANQVVITFNPSTTEAERAAYIQSIGGNVKQSIDALDTVVLEVPQRTVPSALPAANVVADVEPDYYVSALVAVPPSDPFYDQQWALPVIGAPDAWLALPSAAADVVVSVIDSGVCGGHPDLAGRVLPGWDFVDDDTQPQDDFGHGCGVAGIIAAKGDNGVDIAGVAPNAVILPLRVLDAQGIGSYSDVAAAIVYAVDHGAQVINLSLGGANPSNVMANAVDYAVAHDVLVVAAAGNTGGQVLYPAAYAPVIAVGSVDQDLTRSDFSSYGAEIDLMAPGRNILTLTLDSTVRAASGTSFAAPQVAGIAALEIGLGQTLTADGGLAHFAGSAPAVTATAAPTIAPTPLDETSLNDAERALLEQVREQGRVNVIVGLNLTFRNADQATRQELAAQDVAVQQFRAGLIQSLSAYNVEVLSDSDSWSIPFVALEVDQNALAALLASPEVSTIEPNGRNAPSLSSAEPVIHAPQVWAMGYKGTGQTVAILDTGVDRTHPFLGSRVVNEACYSGSVNGTVSNCPNGSSSQTGTGAASPSKCFTNLNTDGCAHGTHVAGIAAGYQSTSFSGVAPTANIMAINVFTKFHDSTGDYLTAFDSDILAGLNYVYNQRNSYSIAALNLSLGDASRGSSSTCNSTSYSMTSIFQLLRGAGIAPVVATGNNYADSFVSFPACISYAVSVGASTDGDQLAYFSNTSARVQTLFAPGMSITSSVPVGTIADAYGTGYVSMNGTSMATPFVTGAFAIYRQLAPTMSVDTIVSKFRATGYPIMVSDGTVPRLNLEAAVLTSLPPTIATPPQNKSINSGQTTTLTVTASGTAPLTYQWYRGTSGDTSTRVGTNSSSFTTPALTSTASYWVRVSNSYGTINSATATVTVAPLEQDFVSNGDFSNGTTGWTFISTTQNVTNGILNFAPLNGSGGFYQTASTNTVTNQTYDLTLNMGNYANGKTINVMVHSPDWSQNYSCVYNVPWLPFQQMQTYTMHLKTAASFTPIVQIQASGDSSMALLVDNIDLHVNGSTAITGTSCLIEPPTNANLVQGGNFTDGLGSWAAFNAQMQIVAPSSNNMMEIARFDDSTYGGFYQYMPYSAGEGDNLEFTFDLGNNSDTNRVINMIVRDADWLDLHSCFINLPAHAPVTTYTMRAHTTMQWQNIVLQGWIQVGTYPTDPIYPFRFDNLGLQSVPSLSVTDTECPVVSAEVPQNEESALATEQVPPTETLMATLTPEVTEEATVETTPEVTVELYIEPTSAVTIQPTATLTTEVTPTVTIEPAKQSSATLTPVPVEQLPTALPFPTLPQPVTATELPVALPFPTLLDPITLTPALTATQLPLTLPALATMDDGAPDWDASAGWLLTDQAAYGGSGLAWQVVTAQQVEHLRWTRPLDLRGSTAQLRFQSLLTGANSTAQVQLSVDGVTWLTVASVSPSDQWTLQTLDLGAYAGQLVYVQFLWSGAPASDAAITGLWSVDEVQVEAALPWQPSPTLMATTPATALPTLALPTLEPTTVPPTLPTATQTPTLAGNDVAPVIASTEAVE